MSAIILALEARGFLLARSDTWPLSVIPGAAVVSLQCGKPPPWRSALPGISTIANDRPARNALDGAENRQTVFHSAGPFAGYATAHRIRSGHRRGKNRSKKSAPTLNGWPGSAWKKPGRLPTPAPTRAEQIASITSTLAFTNTPRKGKHFRRRSRFCVLGDRRVHRALQRANWATAGFGGISGGNAGKDKKTLLDQSFAIAGKNAPGRFRRIPRHPV